MLHEFAPTVSSPLVENHPNPRFEAFANQVKRLYCRQDPLGLFPREIQGIPTVEYLEECFDDGDTVSDALEWLRWINGRPFAS